MFKPTRFTDLEVEDELEVGSLVVKGSAALKGIDPDDYEVDTADAEDAAGEAPTAAEFDAVVALVNDLKEKYNALLTLLATGSDS